MTTSLEHVATIMAWMKIYSAGQVFNKQTFLA